MIDFDFNKYCYGCRNCENICPTNAIRVSENEEGFLVPSIDKQKCISCGLCDKNCPYTNFSINVELKKNIWYSCYLKDVKEREKSTSGGIFPALAKYFLENDGLVCGCVWNKEMKTVHILSDSIENVNNMRGSKYLQSDLQLIIKEIKEKIDKRKILFTGTPCQVAAIKLYIGEHKNLYTCSLFCEGVPSYKVWKKYVDVLEKKYNSKMVYASFRNKEIGWDSPVAKYEFENNKIRKTLSYSYDKYVKGFLQGLYFRNSCNNCQYKGDGHNSDIIIGDLWGADKEQLKKTKYKGISAVILNSDKGKELFEKINYNFSYELIESEKVISYNKLLMESLKKNDRRDEFFRNIDSINIIENINKNTHGNKYVGDIKEFLYKIKVFRIIKNIKRD